MSNEPSSHQPSQSLRRKKFFVVSDAASMQATVNTPAVNGNNGQRIPPSPAQSTPLDQRGLMHEIQDAQPDGQLKQAQNWQHTGPVAPISRSFDPDSTWVPGLPYANRPRQAPLPHRPRSSAQQVQQNTDKITREQQAESDPNRTWTPGRASIDTPPPAHRSRVQVPLRDHHTGGDLPRRPGGRVDLDGTWVPGTIGFSGSPNAVPQEFKKADTFPMMVLRGLSRQQGEQAPIMKSEVSGAAGSAAIVGIGTIVGNFVKYGGTFLIQRGFGAGPYGLYSICLSVVMLVASIFNLGLDDAMIRYISIYRGKRQPHLLRGLAIFCSALAGIAGLIGAIGVWFLAPYIANIKHSPGAIPLLQMMIPFIPLTCMQVVWSAGLQGFKAFKWRVLTQRMIIPAVMLVLLAIELLFFRFLFLSGVVIALLTSTMIGVIVSLYFFIKMLRRLDARAAEQFEFREWLGFATPNFLTSVVDTVLESTDTLLLAFFAIANVAIGQYNAAIKISIFIALPLQSLNVMFTPTIAELYSKGEVTKLSTMFKIVTKWTITFSLPIFWIAVLFSEPLLGLSGHIYGDAWPLLIAFSLGAIMNAGTGSVGYMLLMTGHQKLSFLNSLVAVFVNVVLGVILTPRYGAMGTAIATGIAIGVVNLMRLLQVRLILKMQPYRLDTLKPIVASIGSALVTGVFLFLLEQHHLEFKLLRVVNFSVELTLIPVFLGVYALFLLMFKLDSEDQIVLDALRRKFKRGKN